MDPQRYSTIAHTGVSICNPVSSEALDRTLALLEPPAGAQVLDAGCGKGELLLRLVRQRGAHGVGVDLNAAFLADARARTEARPGPGTLEWIEGDARGHLSALADGSLDAAICVGATHAFGTLGDTLEALARVVRRGGFVLVGEGYWKHTPAPGYLEALGARAEDFSDHAGNLEVGTERGWVPLFTAEASESDWDAYEDGYAANVESFAAAHPHDPDHDAMLERIRAWRECYRRWGRSTLGFGIYLFRC
ncbi:MAG: class I SAM-dependent methyltransferase [Candidatus Eiseniibacteriota bacterium]